MRKDIHISVNNGNFVPSNINGEVDCAEYTEVIRTDQESNMLESKVYLDCYIKKSADKIYARIPYMPITSTAMMRFHIDGNVIRNKFDGGFWFDVCNKNSPIQACKFNLISKTSRFNIKINQETGSADIYSLDLYDFDIIESINQDADLVLKLNKGGYLKEPTIGAGIGSFINGTNKDSEIYKVIQSNLVEDNINVERVVLEEDGNNIFLHVTDMEE